MRPEIQNWVNSAEYDLETARHMLKTGRYLYVVFMCHLCIEKMLKAHVAQVTDALPAKSHDLIYLVKKSGLELPQAHLEFIGLINKCKHSDPISRRPAEGVSRLSGTGGAEVSTAHRRGGKMAEATAAIRRAIKLYQQELERMGFPTERVFLFGSQALGTAREGSDIDLLVISPAWADLSERERLEILGVAAARILEPIQARAATPHEIETQKLSLFLQRALQEQAIAVF